MLGEAHQRLEQVHGTRYEWPDDLLYLVADVDTGVTLSRDVDWSYYLKPLIEPEVRAMYLNGPESTIPELPVHQHALIGLNGGVEASSGGNGYLRFAVEAGMGPFSGYVEPVFWLTQKTTTAYPNRAYGKFGLLGLELTAGFDNVWWGQAKRGSLTISNNARPMPMIRLSLAEPILLPWIFSVLGPLQFDTFAAKLEAERDVPSPALMGVRVNLKPHPALELGASRAAILGGEKVSLTFKDFWKTLLGVEETLPSYTLLTFDARLVTEYFQLYGEAGMEDVHGFVQTDLAYIAGLLIPYVARYFDARIEWADLSAKDWYRSPSFTSGYTYRGRLIGHPVGGGGRELFGEIGAGIRGSKFRAFGAYQTREGRGSNVDVLERHHQVGGSWDFTDIDPEGIGFTAGAEFAYDRIEDANHEVGSGEDLFFAGLTLRGRW